MPWWLCRFFTTDVKAASELALDLPTEERVERFGRPTLIEQFDSLPIEDFQQEFEGKFVDETYSFFPYELILPCTNDELVLTTSPPACARPRGASSRASTSAARATAPSWRCSRRSRAASPRACCGASRDPFAEQEAELRRLLGTLPVARLSIDRSGIGMNLAENLSRDFPAGRRRELHQRAKERWATDFKILLQRRDVTLPRDRELVGQVHAIKRRVLSPRAR